MFESPRAHPLRQQADYTRPLILLVDDDPDFRAVMRHWLAPRYEMIGLASGERVIRELAMLKPNLLILDVLMPGPDGFEVCEKVRSDPRFSSLSILFLTACGGNIEFLKNLEVGGTAFLTKPIQRHELIWSIHELLTSGQ